MHQDISELKTLFINHHRRHCVWKSPGTDSLQVEFRDKIWTLVVSGFVMIWKEGHVWMPQSWKQGQVRLIPKKDKPQTIGDAQQIIILNAHHNMHSHMVAWWLRDSMTTLCLASHCAFIASRHIRNSIVLVNSLIDANTDGVIMMLDWAKVYDLVDHEHLENVWCFAWDAMELDCRD